MVAVAMVNGSMGMLNFQISVKVMFTGKMPFDIRRIAWMAFENRQIFIEGQGIPQISF
jgi:hypothetical protein